MLCTFSDPTSTSCPACRNAVATVNPAMPAPTTITLRGISPTSVARIAGPTGAKEGRLRSQPCGGFCPRLVHRIRFL